jgi:putative PIN family toxin of toxin-antitoxin system
MESSARYVFDTNVLVSALLFEQSVPCQAFRAALGRGRILLSLETLHELNDVLARERLSRYIILEERERFLAALIREGIIVETRETVRVCRDSKDDKFLELALSGGAACVISGDEDLLMLSPFRGVSIMRPAQFLTSLSASE